jgi:hypothetical protein
MWKDLVLIFPRKTPLKKMKKENKDFNAKLPSMTHSSCLSSGKRGNAPISQEVNLRNGGLET